MKVYKRYSRKRKETFQINRNINFLLYRMNLFQSNDKHDTVGFAQCPTCLPLSEFYPYTARCSSHPICSYLQTHFMGFGLLQSVFWNYGWIPLLDPGPLQFFSFVLFIAQLAHTVCFLCETVTAEGGLQCGLSAIRGCACWTWMSTRYYLPTSVGPCFGSLLN